jgi:hypothetical protein
MHRFLREQLQEIRAPRGPSRRGNRRVEVESLEDRRLPSALALVAVSSEPVPPQVAVSSPPRPAACSTYLPSDPCVFSPTLPLPPPRVF